MKNRQSRVIGNIGHTGRRQTKQTKTTTQKAKKIRNTNPTNNRGCTQVQAKGTQFLPLIRQRPRYSYSQYVLDTTIRKQTQIK